MRGGLNVISSKIAPATFYKVRHQIRTMRVAAIMGGKSSPGRADVKGSKRGAPRRPAKASPLHVVPAKAGGHDRLIPKQDLDRQDVDHRDKPGDDD
jgi:hypothetical protein